MKLSSRHLTADRSQIPKLRQLFYAFGSIFVMENSLSGNSRRGLSIWVIFTVLRHVLGFTVRHMPTMFCILP
jgi:hypothetical protein